MPPEERSDEQLIADLNDGDLSAFEALYYRYRDWVARLAERFTGNADDAMDVLQETFAYVHRKFPGFELTARLTTFLYPVVKNLSIAARRKRRRWTGGDDALDQLPAADVIDATGADLAAVVSKLPAIHREVLLMRFVDDLSMDEIARAMGIPQGTVKSRLHHAMEALRKDPRTRELL